MRILLAVLLIPAISSADPKGRPPLHSAKEMMKLMEDSPRAYKISSESSPVAQWKQQNAMLAWPRKREPFHITAIEVRPDGSRGLGEWKGRNEVAPMLAKVEEHFQAKEWDKADKGYAEILAKFPDDYEVALNYGDAALFADKPKLALERYERAGKVNPNDHRSWYYRGNALARLGRKKEALEAWVRALAMRPGYDPMLQGLEPAAETLNYEVRGRTFLPPVRVGTNADGFEISLVVSPHWLGWGVCKAIWLGEPSHRKLMTGSEQRDFTALEETECLASLAAIYEGQRKEKGFQKDPMVEHLNAVVAAKMFRGYSIWEFASRVDPHVYLLQPPEVQRDIEAYVRRFVLVPK